MEQAIAIIAEFIWDVPLIVALMATGLYLTIASNFFSLRCLPLAFTIIWQEFRHPRPRTTGRLTPAEAFFIGLGTTCGFGSITGVALAVTVGGCGAIFWMWVSGLIAMVIKMAEVTLSVYYRTLTAAGHTYGSPMDYIEKGIGQDMHFTAWRWPVAVFGIGFAATMIITLQDYELLEMVTHASGLNPWLIGSVYVLLTYLCIYQGLEGYRKIACWLVPAFLGIYISAGLWVIVCNSSQLWPALQLIVSSAFNGHALLGGLAGHGLLEAVGRGLSISIFTNEAGWGTAAMLYARAETDHPVKLGLLGACEVGVVSLVVCTTTALVVIVSGQHLPGMSAGELVLRSFATGLGNGTGGFIAAMSFLFGLTTVVGWYLYYEVLILYFARLFRCCPKRLLTGLQRLYPLPGLLVVFLATQKSLSEALLWNLMAISTGIPAFINVFAVLILSSRFLDLIDDFRARRQGVPAEPIPRFYHDETAFYGDSHASKNRKM